MKFFLNSLASSLSSILVILLYFTNDKDEYGSFVVLYSLHQFSTLFYNVKFDSSIIGANFSYVLYQWFGYFIPSILISALPFMFLLNAFFGYGLLNSFFYFISIASFSGYYFLLTYHLFENYYRSILLKLLFPVTLSLLIFFFNLNSAESLIISTYISFSIALIMSYRSLKIMRSISFYLNHFIQTITQRCKLLMSSLLDNLSLYIPIFTISSYFGNAIFADYSIFTKFLIFPQVLLSTSLTNYLQLNFDKIRFNHTIRKFILITLIVVLSFICVYTVLYFAHLNSFFQFIGKSVFPFSFKISFFGFCYYSIRFVVNPTSVLLILNENFNLLGKVQMVLLICELISLLILVLFRLDFYEYFLLNTIFGLLGYLFYLKSILSSI